MVTLLFTRENFGFCTLCDVLKKDYHRYIEEHGIYGILLRYYKDPGHPGFYTIEIETKDLHGTSKYRAGRRIMISEARYISSTIKLYEKFDKYICISYPISGKDFKKIFDRHQPYCPNVIPIMSTTRNLQIENYNWTLQASKEHVRVISTNGEYVIIAEYGVKDNAFWKDLVKTAIKENAL